MRRANLIFVLLLSLTAGAEQHTLEQLKAEAEKASGGHQAQLYGTLAQRMVDVADQQFAEGQSINGHESIRQSMEYATKAHDIALSTRQKLKEVEISLRLTQRRMDAVRHTLSVEDRPDLDQAEKKLADFRQEILNAMFAPRRKDKK